MKLIRKANIKSNNESRLKSGVCGECVLGGGRERRGGGVILVVFLEILLCCGLWGEGGRGEGGGVIKALFVEMMKWDENVQLHTCKNKKNGVDEGNVIITHEV